VRNAVITHNPAIATRSFFRPTDRFHADTTPASISPPIAIIRPGSCWMRLMSGFISRTLKCFSA
jgi:hypothetical protein